MTVMTHPSWRLWFETQLRRDDEMKNIICGFIRDHVRTNKIKKIGAGGGGYDRRKFRKKVIWRITPSPAPRAEGEYWGEACPSIKRTRVSIGVRQGPPSIGLGLVFGLGNRLDQLDK